MNGSNPKVDFYFNKKGKWQEELKQLRKVALACGLTEVLKWGVPCYTFGQSNVVLIHEFKEYCALLFFKGALLHDPNHILIQQTEYVQSARQIRFTHIQAIVGLVPVLKTYIYEAVEVEKAGLKVKLKTTADFPVPEEFQQQLDQLPALQSAFNALTPGRQRAYLFHFASAKLAKTRVARIEQCIPQMLNGKGLND